MKNINIKIPDMQSTHCMNRVKDAVSAVEGVQIEELSAGNLIVSLSSDNMEQVVKDAIVKSGYSVSTDVKKEAKECHSGCCTH